jgi:predicted acetyltransferase
MILVRPDRHRLPGYVDALRRGWSPDNNRPEAGREQLATIASDPAAFLAAMDDPHAKAGPVILPDGSQTTRLPSKRRWIWRDGFCGTIGLRWRPGTEALPPTCLGHIGYAVVPWRRREGPGTAALRAILPEARKVGLRHVDVTAAVDNRASIGVIERAGGVFVKAFIAPPETGGGRTVLYRFDLLSGLES